MAHPIHGTLAKTYLRTGHYGFAQQARCDSIRAATIARTTARQPSWPAMIACVTDLRGRFTGAYRTWLDPDGFDPIRLGKAPIATPLYLP